MKTYYFINSYTEEVITVLAPTEEQARKILTQYSNHSDYYCDRVCELEQIDSVS